MELIYQLLLVTTFNDDSPDRNGGNTIFAPIEVFASGGGSGGTDGHH